MAPTATELRTEGEHVAQVCHRPDSPTRDRADLFAYKGRLWRITYGSWSVSPATAEDKRALLQRQEAAP